MYDRRRDNPNLGSFCVLPGCDYNLAPHLSIKRSRMRDGRRSLYGGCEPKGGKRVKNIYIIILY